MELDRAAGADDHRLADGLVLVVPAVGGYLQAIHDLTQLVAVDLGFDSAAVDDLRLATDEIAALLVDHAGGATPLRLSFHADDEDLYVRVLVADPPAGGELDAADLRGELLASTVDSVDMCRRGDAVEAVLQRALPS